MTTARNFATRGWKQGDWRPGNGNVQNPKIETRRVWSPGFSRLEWRTAHAHECANVARISCMKPAEAVTPYLGQWRPRIDRAFRWKQLLFVV